MTDKNIKYGAQILTGLLLAASLIFVSTGYSKAADEEMIKVIIGFDDALVQPFTGQGEVQYKNYSYSEEEAVIKRSNGKVDKKYHLVSAVSAEIPAGKTDEIRSLKNVRYVEPDYPAYILDQAIPWGIQKIKADHVFPYTQGKGVKVGIIDTGIDLSHPDLNVAGDVSFVSGVTNGNDDHGHGSHVAGIVAALNNEIGVVGVAPQAELYAIKVLDHAGLGSTSGIISGIQWAVDNHLDIINMSLGVSNGSTAFQSACDNAFNSGVLVIAAAGNNASTTNTVLYPAKYDSVIAVGAIDSSNRRASFSTTGPEVEIAAPGVEIDSTYKNGGYTRMSGTSMASPHVAGVAALMIASGISDANHNGRINDEVRTRLQQSTIDLGSTGRDESYGFGLIDAVMSIPNLSPTAEAGKDQTVLLNTAVTLDGSASHDPEGAALNYLWSEVSGPSVSFSDNTSVQPVFTPSTFGVYNFQLIVNDGHLSSLPDEVTITVRESNTLPTAPAAAISPVSPLTNDDLVCAIATASNDADLDPITYSYSWYDNNTLQTNLITNIVPSALTTRGEIWRCIVTPSDIFGNGEPGAAEVEIGYSIPITNAGNDQNTTVNKLVTLNASDSSDADGDNLTYTWTLASGPSAEISSQTAVRPNFTPASAGTYIFRLEVGDGTASSTDNVSINATGIKTMHVQSLTLTLSQRNIGQLISATARAVIYDEKGRAIPGVTVRGHWDTLPLVNKSAKTSLSGLVNFTSSTLDSPPQGTVFTFIIDSLGKPGWIYDPGANKAESGSIEVP